MVEWFKDRVRIRPEALCRMSILTLIPVYDPIYCPPPSNEGPKENLKENKVFARNKRSIVCNCCCMDILCASLNADKKQMVE